MAKSKNHTAHNQTHKHHRNGIKKAPPLWKYRAQRGSWLPNIVNTRKVRKANQAATIKARKERLAAFRKTLTK
jgi:large subunit ribosomal protein L29e